MRSAIIPAAVAAALMSAAANAAPIAPLHTAAITPAATLQFRVAFGEDHPLMYPGNWERHQRQWNAIEGRGGNVRPASCARFRSYNRASRTYVNRSGRRVPCP